MSDKLVYSLADLKRDPHRYSRERLESLKHWKYDPETNTLDLGPNGSIYWIPLNRCNSNAQIVDWLCQLANKYGVTAEVLGELVIALNALLKPQQRLCGCAIFNGDTDIDAEKVAATRYAQMYKQE